MKLHLDSTDSKKTIIRLNDQEFSKENSNPRDQNVFRLLQESLDEVGAQLKDIKEISVNAGPGSFTGTRVGVTIANALGFALGIKVNNQPQVVPKYGSPPNITKRLKD